KEAAQLRVHRVDHRAAHAPGEQDLVHVPHQQVELAVRDALTALESGGSGRGSLQGQQKPAVMRAVPCCAARNASSSCGEPASRSSKSSSSHAVGPPSARPSRRSTHCSYFRLPPQRNCSSRETRRTAWPLWRAYASMPSAVPSAPGRTTWWSSRRKTGTRAADISSSSWLRPVRLAAGVKRWVEVSRMRWASSQMRTSTPLGSASVKLLKY